MTRKLPDIKPPVLECRDDAPDIHIRSYRVITPLFGGGVEPQHADPISVVRASEIRGQLRFWWRATQGGQYGPDGLEKMKQDEDKLWGSTSNPSMVHVEVRLVDEGKLVTSYNQRGQQIHIGDPGSPLSYAAFPLRPTGQANKMGGLRFGVRFDLVVTLPKAVQKREQVLAALWAWETFSGIGARTRRGFGAVHCDRVEGIQNAGPWQPLSSKEQDVLRWFQEQLKSFVKPGNGPENVPLINQAQLPVLGKPANIEAFQQEFERKVHEALINSECPPAQVKDWLPALIAWYYPIEQMRKFRQSRHNNAQGRPFGRSHWPEPDEIRWRFSHGFRGRHAHPQPQGRQRRNKFPRAAFGLPIIFQFKDGVDQPQGAHIDPRQTILRGANHDRLASSLILRPLACADGRFVSVALVLNAPTLPPGGLQLEDADQPGGIDIHPLTPAEASFPPLNGKTDVIRAFLNTL